MPAYHLDLAQTRACHCLAARRRARAITRLYDEALRPVGLRATQFSLLAALAQMRESTLTPLAEFLGLDRTTLTRNAEVLLGRGWLAARSTADRRQRALVVTAEGAAVLERALPLWHEVQLRLDAAQEAVEYPGVESRRTARSDVLLGEKEWPA